MQYLAEVTVYDPAIHAERTLYFSSKGFTTGPYESPANTFFDGRIQQPANMRRDLFARGTTGGRSQIGYGECVLTNADGGLDALIDYGFDGRQFVLRLGEGDYPDGFETVLTGTIEQPAFEFNRVVLRVRDRQQELNIPIQANKYAGDNALPAGLEGVADIAGQPKPLVYGTVFNVPAVLVNTARVIYQVNDGPVSDITAVYDRGVLLTQEADYANQAAMEASAPSAGCYRVWPAGGYFRLESDPKGEVTCDVQEGATDAACTVAQIVKDIISGPGDIDFSDQVQLDYLALDAANSAVVGIYIATETAIADVLDELCESVGAWWGFDRLGKFRIVRLEEPEGIPVATFTRDDILRIERIATADTDRGVPANQVILGYQKNYTTQDGAEIAGSAATLTHRQFISQEYRTVTTTPDSTVLQKHLLSPVIRVDTLLTSEADAVAEADRLQEMKVVRRDRLNVRVDLDPPTVAAVDMGVVVSIEMDRFGYDNGKQFRVIGMEPDAAKSVLDLTLWG